MGQNTDGVFLSVSMGVPSNEDTMVSFTSQGLTTAARIPFNACHFVSGTWSQLYEDGVKGVVGRAEDP